MKVNLPVTNGITNHVGLYIGIQTLAAVILDKKGAAPQHAIVERNKPMLSAEGVYETELREAVLELKQKLPFDSRLVAVCFPEKMAFTRTHHLPKLNLAEINEALTWQTDKLFPYEPNEIYTDWRLLRRAPNETVVAVTAVPRLIIDGIKNALLSASLFPVAFEPSVSALARIVPAEAKAAAIVIEVDATGAATTIVIEGVAQMTATNFFESNADSDQKLNEIAGSVKELAAHWQKESAQTTQFTLYLTGAMEPAAAEQMQVKTGMPCVPMEAAGLPMVTHGAYAAANGLVLPPESTATINLLPTGLKRFYEAANVHEALMSLKRSLLLIWGIGVVLAVVFFALVFILANQKNDAVKIFAGGNGNSTVGDLEVITKNAIRLKRLYPKKSSPELLLSTVIAAIPEGTNIKVIAYDPAKKRLRLSGTAPDREGVILVHQKLMETELFVKTDLPLSVLNTTSTGDFSFELGEKT